MIQLCYCPIIEQYFTGLPLFVTCDVIDLAMFIEQQPDGYTPSCLLPPDLDGSSTEMSAE